MTAIGIVAHFDRMTMAEHLAETVDADHIAYDDGTAGCAGNHRRVWEQLAASTDEWAAVLEDDAEPVADFHDQLHAALEAAPAPVVSLYLGRARPPGWQGRVQIATQAANDTSAHWILSNHCLHAVGIAIRTRLIPSMLIQTRDSTLDADDAITSWLQHSGHDIAYTWPSLVDHHDGPTLTDHWDRKTRRQGRTAWNTGTRPTWNNRTVHMRGKQLQRR